MPLIEDPPVHKQVRGVPVEIRRDIYPAIVSFSFAKNPWPKSRAIITRTELIILVEGGTYIKEVYREPLLSLGGNNKMLKIETEDGSIQITKDGNCGCGSSLKSYRPFEQPVYIAP